MAYTTASTDDVESAIPDEWGSMWFFRELLGCDTLGMTLLELAPEAKGKPHDHAEDGQEEAYLVVNGTVTVRLGDGGDSDPLGEELTLGVGEAIRVKASTRRQLHNRGDEPARVAIAGAP